MMSISPRLKFLLTAIVILGLALWVRMTNLYEFPIFIDEGLHISFARLYATRTLDYPFLMHGKFLLGFLLAQLQIVGPNALWLARAALATISLLSCAACISLGAQIASSQIGLFAGLVYALLPYAVFHERQALADPLMATFGSLTCVFALRLYSSRSATASRWRRFGLIGLTAFFLAAAILSKLTGIIYLPVLFLIPLVVPVTSKNRWGQFAQLTAAMILASLLIGLFYLSQSARLGSQTVGQFDTKTVGFIDCPPALCQHDLNQQWVTLKTAGADVLEAIPTYFGWALIVPALIAWRVAFQVQRRKTLWLSLAALGIGLTFAAVSKDHLVMRYVMPIAVPLTVLTALGFLTLTRLLTAGLRPAVGQLLVAGLTMVMLAGPSAALVPMLATPRQTHLISFDDWQYVTGPYSGIGFAEAAQRLDQQARSETRPPLVLMNHLLLTSVEAYLDSSRLSVQSGFSTSWAEALQALAAGRHIYIVDTTPSLAGAADITPNTLALYPRLNGESPVRLRFITDSQPEALQELFTALFKQPTTDDTEYDRLIGEALGATPTLLVPYPPQQTTVLQARLQASPAHPSLQLFAPTHVYPWDTPAFLQSLAAALPDKPLVTVVFFDESRLDPQREVETWLATHLFHLSQQWYGPFRAVTFAQAAEATQTLRPAVRFGENITLEKIDLLDSQIAPGQVVRLRLTWLAQAPIQQSLKVFVHLTLDEAIMAQHDGQPLGELRPTSTWKAGETIVEQIALWLPAQAQSGQYHLRIGMYDVFTQTRVPAQQANGDSVEFYVGGDIEVK